MGHNITFKNMMKLYSPNKNYLDLNYVNSNPTLKKHGLEIIVLTHKLDYDEIFFIGKFCNNVPNERLNFYHCNNLIERPITEKKILKYISKKNTSFSRSAYKTIEADNTFLYNYMRTVQYNKNNSMDFIRKSGKSIGDILNMLIPSDNVYVSPDLYNNRGSKMYYVIYKHKHDCTKKEK